MPVRNYPLRPHGTLLKPMLPVIIENPHTGKTFLTHGIIDTGADICVLTEEIALEVGHDLAEGTYKKAGGVGGVLDTYLHTTIIRVLGFNNVEFYCSGETQVAYAKGFEDATILLGVRGFLDRYRLEIDYPNKKFSLINSEPERLQTLTP